MTVAYSEILALLEVVSLPQDLVALKRLAARRRRGLAKKYHPDRGGDASRMARINAVCDAIEALTVLPALRYTLIVRVRR